MSNPNYYENINVSLDKENEVFIKISDLITNNYKLYE